MKRKEKRTKKEKIKMGMIRREGIISDEGNGIWQRKEGEEEGEDEKERKIRGRGSKEKKNIKRGKERGRRGRGIGEEAVVRGGRRRDGGEATRR